MRPSTSNEDRIFRLLTRIGMSLEIPIGRSDMPSDEALEAIDAVPGDDGLSLLVGAARLSGIFLKVVSLNEPDDIFGFLDEGYPIVICRADGTYIFVSPGAGSKFDAATIGDSVSDRLVSRRKIRRLTAANEEALILVAKKELECDVMASHGEHDDHHGEHLQPLKRFIRLLNLERRDVVRVVMFAAISGILTLATPLAVESLVNVVSWGTYIQPLVVLGIILATCLGLAGAMKILQTIMVEVIQQRQFVRIVGDLAHRFPRANRDALAGEFPRELANRVFDIMTIQKATATLLLDGISIVLTTVLGLVLLGFYHPFLLGFDIVLVLSMVFITWFLGRGGIDSAIKESITKYRVAHWLQDVLSSPSVFKAGGGELFAIERANQLTSQYLVARRSQFRVILRQVIFAIGLQVVASTVVLALGGYLVIDGQLTLGQLVASELVVTAVVGAFAKAGKSLEKFYDLMAGVDKVGHLIDLPTDPRSEAGFIDDGALPVRWRELNVRSMDHQVSIPEGEFSSGQCVAIIGNDLDAKSEFAHAIAGLSTSTHGMIQIGDIDTKLASRGPGRKPVGLAAETEIFHGSVRENIDLGQAGIGANRVRQVLSQVGLLNAVLAMDDGIDSKLQTGGAPLSISQRRLLLLARAIVTEPRVLVVDRIFDDLPTPIVDHSWKSLAGKERPWTLVVVTSNSDIAERCETTFEISRSFDQLQSQESES